MAPQRRARPQIELRRSAGPRSRSGKERVLEGIARERGLGQYPNRECGHKRRPSRAPPRTAPYKSEAPMCPRIHYKLAPIISAGSDLRARNFRDSLQLGLAKLGRLNILVRIKTISFQGPPAPKRTRFGRKGEATGRANGESQESIWFRSLRFFHLYSHFCFFPRHYFFGICFWGCLWLGPMVACWSWLWVL